MLTRASAVLTVHRQGRVLVPTLRSILAARDHARRCDCDVELVVIADRCDALTRSILERFAGALDRVAETDLGDPGAARRAGVALAGGDSIFFHDADDLYCTDWYARCLAFAAQDPARERTIYHGEIMVGFGSEFYYRIQTASTEPGFEPLALTCQWYFATNLMAPAEVCRRHPIPDHDARAGLGHDDWAWSCDTLAAGIARAVVPGAISFYREKPVGQGVGKVPGIIHPRSPLFDPAMVRASTAAMAARHHACAPYGIGGSPDGRNRAHDGFVPDWVIERVREQAVFEPMLTDLYDAGRAPRVFRSLPQQAHVGLAYRDLCDDLDDRPKIIITATEAFLVAADVVIGEILRGAALRYAGECQIICLVEGQLSHWNRKHAARQDGILLLDINEFRARHRLEEWYFFRFMMRLFVQPDVRMVLDLGSRFFQRLFDEFARPLCALIGDIRFAYPMLDDDLISDARINIVRNIAMFARTARRPARVFSCSVAFARSAAAQPCLAAVLPPPRRRALGEALLRRFARDQSVRAACLADADLAGLLLSPLDDVPTVAPANAPDDRGSAQERTVRPRDAVHAVTVGHGRFAPQCLELARRKFAAEPATDLLVPQVVFWRDRADARMCLWFEPHNLPRQLAACVDQVARHGVHMPFFAFCRGSGPAYARFRSLDAQDWQDDSIAFFRFLVAYASTAVVRPLDSAVCACTDMLPASTQSLFADA